MSEASWPKILDAVTIVKHEIRRNSLVPSTLEVGNP